MATYQGPMTVTLKMETVNFAPDNQQSGGSPATSGAFLAL